MLNYQRVKSMVYPPSFDRQQSQDRAINHCNFHWTIQDCWSMSLARCQPCTVSAWNNLSLIVFAEIWCTNIYIYIYLRKFGVPKYITILVGTKIWGCSLWVESSWTWNFPKPLMDGGNEMDLGTPRSIRKPRFGTYQGRINWTNVRGMVCTGTVHQTVQRRCSILSGMQPPSSQIL